MFVPDNVPKFSYAASFGVSEIPKGQQKLYKTFLSRLNYISVRENAGQKIVKELTGRDAQVVADPVMLLTREQWDEEIKFKRMYDQPYIFAYFLGKSEENREQAKSLPSLQVLKSLPFTIWIPTTRQMSDLAIMLRLRLVRKNSSTL